MIPISFLDSNEIPDNRTTIPRLPASMNMIAPDTPGDAIATRRMTVERTNPVFLAKFENSVIYLSLIHI